jgi:hypothetical protein
MAYETYDPTFGNNPFEVTAAPTRGSRIREMVTNPNTQAAMQRGREFAYGAGRAALAGAFKGVIESSGLVQVDSNGQRKVRKIRTAATAVGAVIRPVHTARKLGVDMARGAVQGARDGAIGHTRGVVGNALRGAVSHNSQPALPSANTYSTYTAPGFGAQEPYAPAVWNTVSTQPSSESNWGATWPTAESAQVFAQTPGYNPNAWDNPDLSAWSNQTSYYPVPNQQNGANFGPNPFEQQYPAPTGQHNPTDFGPNPFGR